MSDSSEMNLENAAARLQIIQAIDDLTAAPRAVEGSTVPPEHYSKRLRETLNTMKEYLTQLGEVIEAGRTVSTGPSGQNDNLKVEEEL